MSEAPARGLSEQDRFVLKNCRASVAAFPRRYGHFAGLFHIIDTLTAQLAEAERDEHSAVKSLNEARAALAEAERQRDQLDATLWHAAISVRLHREAFNIGLQCGLRNADERDQARAEVAALTGKLEQRESEFRRLIGAIQQFQPDGSPPPGDVVILARWILIERIGAAVKRAETAEGELTALRAERDTLKTTHCPDCKSPEPRLPHPLHAPTAPQ